MSDGVLRAEHAPEAERFTQTRVGLQGLVVRLARLSQGLGGARRRLRLHAPRTP